MYGDILCSICSAVELYSRLFHGEITFELVDFPILGADMLECKEVSIWSIQRIEEAEEEKSVTLTVPSAWVALGIYAKTSLVASRRRLTCAVHAPLLAKQRNY